MNVEVVNVEYLTNPILPYSFHCSDMSLVGVIVKPTISTNRLTKNQFNFIIRVTTRSIT